MNWITKFIKPKIKSLFKKRSSNVEENLWTTCSCKNLIYAEDMESNQKVCPKCGEHHKLTCKERFNTFFDQKEFELIETPLPKDDPLNFEDKKKYTDRLKAARKLTGQDDAILIAKGKVQNIDVVVGAQDFRFIGGSFGAASGEAFIAGAQHAIENNMPYIFFSCSGGQRMHESSIALMQMSRTALAVNELKRKNVPFIVILTNPTTGGVTASWAMLGDVIISEVADHDDWKTVRDDLIKNTGINTIPHIYVERIENLGNLVLKHEFDGRDLEINYAEKVVKHIENLWGKDVKLYTILEEEVWEVCAMKNQ